MACKWIIIFKILQKNLINIAYFVQNRLDLLLSVCLRSVFWIGINLFRIQHFRLDPGFWWPKIEKNYSRNFFFYSFVLRIAICLSLSLHKVSWSCRRSLNPLKEKIEHFKTWNFLIFFSIFVGLVFPPGSGSRSGFLIRIRIRIWIPDPDTDPLTWSNPDPTWIRIRNTV